MSEYYKENQYNSFHSNNDDKIIILETLNKLNNKENKVEIPFYIFASEPFNFKGIVTSRILTTISEISKTRNFENIELKDSIKGSDMLNKKYYIRVK